MRQHTMLFVSLVAGTVLFASACSDTTQPMPASDDKVGFDPLQQPDDPVALVRNIHGFGGFFFDREGVPTVYLRDVSARAQVERALGPLARRAGAPGRRASGAPGGLRLGFAGALAGSGDRRGAGHAWRCIGGRGRSQESGDDWGGARNADGAGAISGRTARRSVGRRSGRGGGAGETGRNVAETAFGRSWEPSRSTSIPIRARPAFVCTLGFNATRNGQRSFITNSHCTNAQGGNRVNALLAADPGRGTDADRDRGGRSGVHHRRQLPAGPPLPPQ